jgi:hypothetical protein
MIIKKNCPVHHDIQKSSVPGQALGFKPVNDFFAVKFFNSEQGLFFGGFGHKGNDLSFKLRQRPPKNAFKGRVQIRDGIVQIKYKYRVRQKFQKRPIALFDAGT